MLTPSQIKQLAELVKEADVDTSNEDEVNEYIYMLLEDIAGFESIDEETLVKIVSDIKKCLGYWKRYVKYSGNNFLGSDNRDRDSE